MYSSCKGNNHKNDKSVTKTRHDTKVIPISTVRHRVELLDKRKERVRSDLKTFILRKCFTLIRINLTHDAQLFFLY